MLQFSDDIDQILHALADPTRRRMIEHLSAGEASVSALAAPFPVSLSAIQQHLGVLQAAGLVTTRKAGRVRLCRMDTGRLDLASDWLARRKESWSRKMDRLDDYLNRET